MLVGAATQPQVCFSSTRACPERLRCRRRPALFRDAVAVACGASRGSAQQVAMPLRLRGAGACAWHPQQTRAEAWLPVRRLLARMCRHPQLAL